MSRFAKLQPNAPPTPSAEAEVTAAEGHFNTRFPTGYREFITRYGRGILGGFMRVATPADLLNGPNNVREWRARIDEYWFWDGSADLLPKAKALECIVIADTVGGDEFVFHPSQPDRIYVLAHDFDEIYLASESGIEAAADWLFTAGVLDEPFGDDSFEPY